MGFQLSVETWISSGQYCPGLCQGGPTYTRFGRIFGGEREVMDEERESEVLREKNIQVIFVLGFVLSIYTYFCIVFLG